MFGLTHERLVASSLLGQVLEECPVECLEFLSGETNVVDASKEVMTSFEESRLVKIDSLSRLVSVGVESALDGVAQVDSEFLHTDDTRCMDLVA